MSSDICLLFYESRASCLLMKIEFMGKFKLYSECVPCDCQSSWLMACRHLPIPYVRARGELFATSVGYLERDAIEERRGELALLAVYWFFVLLNFFIQICLLFQEIFRDMKIYILIIQNFQLFLLLATMNVSLCNGLLHLSKKHANRLQQSFHFSLTFIQLKFHQFFVCDLDYKIFYENMYFLCVVHWTLKFKITQAFVSWSCFELIFASYMIIRWWSRNGKILYPHWRVRTEQKNNVQSSTGTIFFFEVYNFFLRFFFHFFFYTV